MVGTDTGANEMFEFTQSNCETHPELWGFNTDKESEINNPVDLVQFINQFGAVTSMSEGRRLLNSGAVKVDGEDIRNRVGIQVGQTISFGKHLEFTITEDHI